MRQRAVLLCCALLLGLVACAGGGGEPRKRIFPPELRLQELQLNSDQRWVARVRITSFSTVPMQLGQLRGELRLGDGPRHGFEQTAAITIAAHSVEVVDVVLAPAADDLAAVNALAAGSSLRYQLQGTLSSREPRRDFEFDYSSALARVPGLDDVLR